MQLVSGQSLQEKLDMDGPLGLKEILRIGFQTVCGLAAAHAQGLVHRDIKPVNSLLENGVELLKITDFGLARAVADASVTQSGVIAGTPMYMAPEQAEGHALDHRSDLFSLGSVLYVMCTGRAPFRASGTMAVLKRVIEDTPTPIRESNNAIPEWLGEIIAKLHAKKPAERYQSAKEVAEVLGDKLAELQFHGHHLAPRDTRGAEPANNPVPAPATILATSGPNQRAARGVAGVSAPRVSRGAKYVIAAALLRAVGAGTFFLWPCGDGDVNPSNNGGQQPPVIPVATSTSSAPARRMRSGSRRRRIKSGAS